jgi:LacI family transcriptional regulator
VSVATVSRVLNDYPDVSPETRARVWEAIRVARFVPDRTARSLVTGRGHVIAVILETGDGHPDLLHPFFQEVLVGLKRSVGASSYDLLLLSAPADDGGYERRIRHNRVDGVVMMGARRTDPWIAEVLEAGVPCMAVDLDVAGPRAGWVASDNVEGAAMAVQHLHELGHRRIALIGGPEDTKPGADRLLGFRREVARLGLPPIQGYEQEGDFYPGSGHAAMRTLLDLPQPPTAVVAASDLMAASAIQAVAERGLRVAGDVAVVGFDDIQIAALLHPSLTTIRQDKRGLGTAAAEALVRLIDDPDLEPPGITLPVELVVRESSGSTTGPVGRVRPLEG